VIDQPAPAAPRAALRVNVFVAPVACLMCGTEAGVVESLSWPPRQGEAVWHRSDMLGARPEALTSWAQLPRCSRCGGNLVTERVEEHWRVVEAEEAFMGSGPRRGRPPKWLVEQRRLARGA
jgi:hypothetical protein